MKVLIPAMTGILCGAVIAMGAGENDIVESFDTNDFEDTAFAGSLAKAAWNPASQPGSLVGVASSTHQEIAFSSPSGDVVPWNSGQARCQNLYTAAQMGGTPRTITGFAWRTVSGGAPTAATYGDVSVLLGHNLATSPLNSNFTGSYAGTPTTLVSGASYSPDTSQSNWITGPAFTGSFAYDGTNRLVLEISTGTGTAQNQTSGTSASGALTMIRQLNNGGASFSFTNHDVRFLTMVDRSEARSLWYDSAQDDPDYLDPVIEATASGGTEATVLFQGAPEDPSAPGTPDLANASDWTSDPAGVLSGLRFLRFHVEFRADLASGAVPSVERILIPVGDRTPPEFTTLGVTPSLLSPPNGKMTAVEVLASASDDRDPAPACRILSVSCDEGGEGDWEITGDLTADLRADRDGGGDGRVYTLLVECRDAAGNATEGTVEVVVPHDQR